MNLEAFDLYKNADRELNEVYDQILLAYAEDEIFISNLKKAQNLWIQFRDEEPDPCNHGSVKDQ